MNKKQRTSGKDTKTIRPCVSCPERGECGQRHDNSPVCQRWLLTSGKSGDRVHGAKSNNNGIAIVGSDYQGDSHDYQGV